MGRFASYSFLPLFLLFPIIIQHAKPAMSLPLSTISRWIVDEQGQRVKLACVNWVSHLEPVVAEGLSKQPMDMIAKRIVSMGFNCVRFTWPLFLVTNDSFASLTVRQSFQRLGLLESIAGIQANNPSIIDVSLIKAYQVRNFCPCFFLRKIRFPHATKRIRKNKKKGKLKKVNLFRGPTLKQTHTYSSRHYLRT